MYVYRSDNGKFAVGYFLDGDFKVASRHDTRTAAQRRVNYLNGGSGGTPPPQNGGADFGRDS
jgi:hypothetical protein